MSEGREQAIRERAYFLWEQEGHPRGGSISHWLRAETEAETEAEAEAAASTATGEPNVLIWLRRATVISFGRSPLSFRRCDR